MCACLRACVGWGGGEGGNEGTGGCVKLQV